jgi:hypothetical protein
MARSEVELGIELNTKNPFAGLSWSGCWQVHLI